MKKTILLSLFAFAFVQHQAQCHYKIEFTNEAYPDSITNGDTLFNAAPWSSGNRQKINLPFPFKFFDSTFQSVYYEASGRLVFDDDHYYFSDLISCIGYQDEAGFSVKTLSPIITVTETTPNGSIVRIRAQNVRLELDPNKQVNFEIQIHQNNTIKCFVGAHSVIIPSNDISYGPYIGAYRLQSISPVIFKSAQNRIGTLNTAHDSCFNGEILDYLDFEFDDFPIQGTVITLEPLVSVGINKPFVTVPTITVQNDCIYITSHQHLNSKATITNIATAQEYPVQIIEGKITKKLTDSTYYIIKIEDFAPVKFFVP